MPDEYIARYQRLIRATIHSDEDLEDLINKIYEDGFVDGQDYQKNLDPTLDI